MPLRSYLRGYKRPVKPAVKKPPPMLFPCFWCGLEWPHTKLTQDHLIPRWAFTTYPELTAHQGYVRACASCNGEKSAMPPALFLTIMHDRPAVVLERGRWQGLSNLCRYKDLPEPLVSNLRTYVVGAMQEPLPKEFCHATHHQAWLATSRLRRMR